MIKIGKALGLAAGKGIKRYRVGTKSRYEELQHGKYVGSAGVLAWGPLKRTTYVNVAAKSKKQAQIRGFKKLGKQRKIGMWTSDSGHVFKMDKFERPKVFKYKKGQKAKRTVDVLKHKYYGKFKKSDLIPDDYSYTWGSY
mgnify:FL=1